MWGKLLRLVPPWAWAILAMFLYIGYLNTQIATREREIRRLALRTDSLQAEADTTRARALDSQMVYARRVVQAEQRADRADRELRLARTAFLAARVTIDSLHAQLEIPVIVDTGNVRTGTFSGYRPPYHFAVDVALPAPPAAGRAAIAISLDTIPVGISLGCAPRDPSSGVRPAVVQARTPAWATLQWASVSQSPEVCAPQSILQPKRSHSWLWDAVLVVSTAVGTYFLVR